jgi:hypothetical protein
LFSGTVFAQAPAETPAPPVNAPPVLTDAPPAAPAAPPAAPAAVVAAPPAAAPAAPAAPLWYSLLRFEALVDSYYQYNFAGAGTKSDPTTPLAVRNFDVTNNSFSLNFAKVAAQLDVSPITLRIDLAYGHTAALINASGRAQSGLTGMGGAGASLYGSAFMIEQAYSSLALGPVTIDFGKFVTTAGAEVNEANKNWLYSRSLLFYTIPILHTGARVNYKVNDMVSVQASVVNGINNDPDNNGWKTVGLSTTITPVSTTSVILTDYFGKEGPQGAMEGDIKNSLDVVISQTLTDKLTLNLNVDYIHQHRDTSDYTLGGALMAHYVLSDALNFSARAEYVKDKNGLSFALGDTSFYEGTLSAAAPFAGHLEVRLEARADIAKDKVFPGAKDNQVTGTVAFLSYL